MSLRALFLMEMKCPVCGDFVGFGGSKYVKMGKMGGNMGKIGKVELGVFAVVF